jgi:hypothetical protein
MCKFCTFISDSKQNDVYWTKITHAHFKRLTRDGVKQCKSFSKVQSRVLCFHESHEDVPKEHCKSTKNHESTIFCLMHPSKTESLPIPLDISSVAQEYSKSNITKKAFSVDNKFRTSIQSKDRNSFARQGYLSMNINFTPDQEKELITFMEQTAASGEAKVVYDNGHYGHQIVKEQMDRLPYALCHALLPPDLLQNVEFYFW